MWPLAHLIYYLHKCLHKGIKTKSHGYIAINRNLQLDAVIFADDFVLLAASEDDF
jgi:hypothetical protein